VAVLGLGEAGAAIAADLAAEGAEVEGFDPGDVPTPDGVRRHGEPGDAVAGAGLVLAVTPAAGARAALDGVVDHLGAGTVYADLSTSSPGAKRALAELAAAHGVAFVDVALMAPVPGRGLATPALASGPGADALVARLRPLGMPVTSAGPEPGTAATRKLLRSIVMKGLAQLLIEALAAAEAAGLADETRDDLVAQLSAIDEALVDRLVTGTPPHAARRAHELEAAVALLDELGADATMSRATSSRLRAQAAARTDGAPGTG
jgi:3-hydroxyisobutyrate dehydrogenase-like beta-hydroxyacid dehydrogenase